ncbi:hypothetical protein CIHG_06952 [Coccidioides immitis H538.4]|uniref:Uncharacterized protein n=2 Tax=Coccidioides immitis TaxID=5501 RepID=A0A0J8RXH2_COCIT|nr:hypothetical protein CIRG_09996 [Coccidioides immitis RMSCC 2394]KMU89281.1 hypothetical protein CIHG_06952 [Coccidioides immitis H538.4]
MCNTRPVIADLVSKVAVPLRHAPLEKDKRGYICKTSYHHRATSSTSLQSEEDAGVYRAGSRKAILFVNPAEGRIVVISQSLGQEPCLGMMGFEASILLIGEIILIPEGCHQLHSPMSCDRCGIPCAFSRLMPPSAVGLRDTMALYTQDPVY